MATADEDRHTSTPGTDLAATPTHPPKTASFGSPPGEESIGTRVAAALTWSMWGPAFGATSSWDMQLPCSSERFS